MRADVAFVRELIRKTPRDSTVAVEQAWRTGGRLYLHPRETIDLDPDRLGDPQYLWQVVPADAVLALDSRTTARHGLEAPLRARGYDVTPLVVSGSRYRVWIRAGLSQSRQ